MSVKFAPNSPGVAKFIKSSKHTTNLFNFIIKSLRVLLTLRYRSPFFIDGLFIYLIF